MERTTKGDVDEAIRELNVAANALGLERRFEMRYGSASAGVSHEILEYHPSLSHPTTTKIGQTYAAAVTYLRAMRHALQSAKFDRDYRREEAVKAQDLEGRDELGYPRGMRASVGIFDPDSRTTRRRYETDGPVDLGAHPKGYR